MNRLEDIMPNFWDNDFEPLSCGIIEVWADSTCTVPLTLYSSPAMEDTVLKNPYHLTSAGRQQTPIYFKENGAFVVVKNKDEVPIKSYEYEISSSLQGDLQVENDIVAGRNLVSIADTNVGRNLTVKGKAIITGDITAENATIANAIGTKDLAVANDIEVANHTKTKTLEATDRLEATNKAIVKDIDVTGVLNMLGIITGAKFDSIEIAKSMKLGALNVFVGQTFVNEAIVNSATYLRCTFTKLLELGGNVSNVKFMSCAFNEGVKLAANSYNSLHIEDCIFASGKKINLTNPACAFNQCKIRRNESLGSNPFAPLNLDMEGALFKIKNDGGYKLQTNLIATNDLMARDWKVNFIIEVEKRLPSDGADTYDKSLYKYHKLEQQRGTQDELEVKISITDTSSDSSISYIRFIPGGV